ncbi:hypothetical protein Ancab_014933 [Ancistrocladus abbreviatus]
MRLIMVQCYSMKDTANSYTRPVEGLTVVDMDTHQVVEIVDRGKNIPIISQRLPTEIVISQPQRVHQQMNLINPISLEQPTGPSFTVENGHLVKWANWEFNLKPDLRPRVIIAQAMIQDPDSRELRSVIYKGMTSELSVPYIDPTNAWYFKTYMDADMDIDKSDNSFLKVNIQRQRSSLGESPRRSYLKATRNMAKTEKDAQTKLKLYDPSEFHAIN